MKIWILFYTLDDLINEHILLSYYLKFAIDMFYFSKDYCISLMPYGGLCGCSLDDDLLLLGLDNLSRWLIISCVVVEKYMWITLIYGRMIIIHVLWYDMLMTNIWLIFIMDMIINMMWYIKSIILILDIVTDWSLNILMLLYMNWLLMYMIFMILLR